MPKAMGSAGGVGDGGYSAADVALRSIQQTMAWMQGLVCTQVVDCFGLGSAGKCGGRAEMQADVQRRRGEMGCKERERSRDEV